MSKLRALCRLLTLLCAPLAAVPAGCHGGGTTGPRDLPQEVPLALVAPRPYPTRSVFFSGGASEPHKHCQRPDRGFAYSDYLYFAKLSEVPVGRDIEAGPFDRSLPANWENMGFVSVGADRWRRVARLDGTDAMHYIDEPALPTIDCIAISSIDRHNGHRPYIYETLVSLLKVLPPGVAINIMVGNNDTAYLAPETLVAEGVAAEHLENIHVLPSDAGVAAFLADVFADSVRQRASWNYARTLRSYSGSRGLLFLEDDVDWAEHGLRHFAHVHRGERLPVVSLFQHTCAPLTEPLHQAYADGRESFQVHKPRMENISFYCTQAMYYSADVANEIGRYLQPRMHEDGYDQMINRFIHRHGLQVGYAFPSLVQHTGRDSTGLSEWFPASHCFVPSLPWRPWPAEGLDR